MHLQHYSLLISATSHKKIKIGPLSVKHDSTLDFSLMIFFSLEADMTGALLNSKNKMQHKKAVHSNETADLLKCNMHKTYFISFQLSSVSSFKKKANSNFRNVVFVVYKLKQHVTPYISKWLKVFIGVAQTFWLFFMKIQAGISLCCSSVECLCSISIDPNLYRKHGGQLS